MWRQSHQRVPCRPKRHRAYEFGGGGSINVAAAVVNADPDRIKVVLLPGYNVSAAEVAMAVGNVPEQISLVGKEASSTGTRATRHLAPSPYPHVTSQ
jgi:Carbohydrate phosphorylase